MNKNPRFKRTARIAAKMLIEHKIDNLPVDPFKIIKQHKNWRAMTYYQFGKLNRLDEEEVIFQIGSKDGCAFYEASKNRYLIIYNDDPLWIETPRRITWTIIHEIGHIVLGHLEETGEAMITRAALGEEKYNILEAEAEFFAANILAPFPVLYRLKLFTYEKIMEICCISKRAAENRLKHISRRIKQRRIYGDDLIIESHFYNFIYQKKCTCCGYGFISTEAKYCPICGDKLIWGEGKMIYNDGYELDENGRAIKCPRCGNEELDYEGDYCTICGTYLVNKCAATEGPNQYFNSCGTIVPGNARYCYKCGNETTFYQDKLLKPWEKAKALLENSEKEVAAVLEEEINEDDLPF